MPILSRKKKTPLGIYIHVPFCRSKCQYCDFYSLTQKDDRLLDGYLDAVCDHIREAGPQAPDYQVDTVYFGGGTPSFFGADGMAAILTAIWMRCASISRKQVPRHPIILWIRSILAAAHPAFSARTVWQRS